MTLWDMLDKTKYYQKVWIFEINATDQNMPIFKGTVDEARRDADMVWDYLPCDVEVYDCDGGILDIRVRTQYYDDRFEGRYSSSDRLGRRHIGIELKGSYFKMASENMKLAEEEYKAAQNPAQTRMF